MEYIYCAVHKCGFSLCKQTWTSCKAGSKPPKASGWALSCLSPKCPSSRQKPGQVVGRHCGYVCMGQHGPEVPKSWYGSDLSMLLLSAPNLIQLDSKKLLYLPGIFEYPLYLPPMQGAVLLHTDRVVHGKANTVSQHLTWCCKAATVTSWPTHSRNGSLGQKSPTQTGYASAPAREETRMPHPRNINLRAGATRLPSRSALNTSDFAGIILTVPATWWSPGSMPRWGTLILTSSLLCLGKNPC